LRGDNRFSDRFDPVARRYQQPAEQAEVQQNRNSKDGFHFSLIVLAKTPKMREPAMGLRAAEPRRMTADAKRPLNTGYALKLVPSN